MNPALRIVGICRSGFKREIQAAKSSDIGVAAWSVAWQHACRWGSNKVSEHLEAFVIRHARILPLLDSSEQVQVHETSTVATPDDEQDARVESSLVMNTILLDWRKSSEKLRKSGAGDGRQRGGIVDEPEVWFSMFPSPQHQHACYPSPGMGSGSISRGVSCRYCSEGQAQALSGLLGSRFAACLDVTPGFETG